MIVHDEDAAARKAVEFADLAFIKHDAPAAYALLTSETRSQIPIAKFTEVLDQMHPSGYPTSVTATQYEPIMGQRMMNILLVGQNGDQKYFYRFVMAGTKETGYAVGGFFRRGGPYQGDPNMHGEKMLQTLKTPYTVPSSGNPSTASSGTPSSSR